MTPCLNSHSFLPLCQYAGKAAADEWSAGCPGRNRPFYGSDIELCVINWAICQKYDRCRGKVMAMGYRRGAKVCCRLGRWSDHCRGGVMRVFSEPLLASIYTRDDFVIILDSLRGRSSVVERHVANVNVEGSNPFARFQMPSCRAAARNCS